MFAELAVVFCLFTCPIGERMSGYRDSCYVIYQGNYYLSTVRRQKMNLYVKKCNIKFIGGVV